MPSINDLQDIKRERTILMATNSMEAADLLADRIAIIANGKIECYGSKMYLNRRYGKILKFVDEINLFIRIKKAF